MTIADFQVCCPVCRLVVSNQVQELMIMSTFHFREIIGDYNLTDLLESPPPIAERPEPLKYTISEDVREMQRKMQELFLQQKEKGGIIDLEAEGKKYLVVTNSSNSQDETFTELSPTDYQLGKLSLDWTGDYN